jgi:hypothetical protein
MPTTRKTTPARKQRHILELLNVLQTAFSSICDDLPERDPADIDRIVDTLEYYVVLTRKKSERKLADNKVDITPLISARELEIRRAEKYGKSWLR